MLKMWWQEQLMLVEEEMCWILCFFDYHEELWRSQVTLGGGGIAGISAYARKRPGICGFNTMALWSFQKGFM
ncbi:hypothetical protein HETIRDRAFT_309801 [Heterobasidion irregulare TC 32-1]|uniref:Uncharacterized protein n=1 Tax=Heterobasidion irregulare (strain TC 32-1) TaxID=747525 RepID=W4KHB5_HETIT|nr:uncharacterized protein HETIRDRAFT_309801 [Heterobasidion irregulare TC 32-1]ETW85109.1 hypothetical protein HETIRDRAFT_309801 [Heterobasidion irregulare TC 32-1]